MKINCSQYVHGDDKTCQRATEWLTGLFFMGTDTELVSRIVGLALHMGQPHRLQLYFTYI